MGEVKTTQVIWGSVAGPIMAGAIYDRTESYAMALWIMLGLLIFAMLLVLFLIRPLEKPHGGDESRSGTNIAGELLMQFRS